MNRTILDRLFKLSDNGTNVRTEVLAGLTTFLTMAYIIFVQPAVLSGKMFGIDTGMDFGAVTTATCLSAALATAVMAIYARYPIAQAPGMGENFFFVFSAIPAATAAGFANGWQVALGVVFVSGVLFLILSLVGLRELIFNSVSPSMKNGIAAGIGLFIAFVGLQQSGVIIKDPGSAVKLNAHLASPDSIVFFIGLMTTAVLHARRVRGSILWGILVATVLTCLFKIALPQMPSAISAAPEVTESMLMKRFEFAKALLAPPPSIAPTFLKMDAVHALTVKMLPFIFVFLFMLTFDAIGTLIGVCELAGFMRNNKLPRAKQAMVSDAIGTVTGATLGEHSHEFYRERGWRGGRRANRANRPGGRCSFFIRAVFQSTDYDDRKLSVHHCTCAGNCRRDDDAKCHQNSLEGLHRVDSRISDHHRHSVFVFDRGRPGAWLYQLSCH